MGLLIKVQVVKAIVPIGSASAAAWPLDLDQPIICIIPQHDINATILSRPKTCLYCFSAKLQGGFLLEPLDSRVPVGLRLRVSCYRHINVHMQNTNILYYIMKIV